MHEGPYLFQKPSDTEIEEAIQVLIRASGDNPDREGLKETPSRLRRVFQETYFSGYRADIEKILEASFDERGSYEGLIVLRDIPYYSLCEHHLLPVIGTAHVGYVPDESVVGLSKLARLVDAFARRLQIQERMTANIADALENHLEPLGTAVRLEAEHLCMASRGAVLRGNRVVTQVWRGCLAEPEQQHEFFEMIHQAKLR